MPDTAQGNSPDTDAESTCRVLMSVSPSSPHETKTGTHTAISNSARATTITVVLEKILAHSGYRHGGINE